MICQILLATEKVQLKTSINLLFLHAHLPAFTPTKSACLTHSKFTCTKKDGLAGTLWKESMSKTPKQREHVCMRTEYFQGMAEIL